MLRLDAMHKKLYALILGLLLSIQSSICIDYDSVMQGVGMATFAGGLIEGSVAFNEQATEESVVKVCLAMACVRLATDVASLSMFWHEPSGLDWGLLGLSAGEVVEASLRLKNVLEEQAKNPTAENTPAAVQVKSWIQRLSTECAGMIRVVPCPLVEGMGTYVSLATQHPVFHLIGRHCVASARLIAKIMESKCFSKRQLVYVALFAAYVGFVAYKFKGLIDEYEQQHGFHEWEDFFRNFNRADSNQAMSEADARRHLNLPEAGTLTPEQITRAYRQQGLAHHPDRHAAESVEEQARHTEIFKQVNTAQEVLKRKYR